MIEHNMDHRLLTYSREWAIYTEKAAKYQRFIMQVVGYTNALFTQFEYTGLFLTLLENSDDNPRLKNLRDQIEGTRDSKSVAATSLASLPFEGVKVMEIGGPFGQVLHTLGAEVWCVDPDIEGKSEFQKMDWNYSPSNRNETYHPIPQRLTLANWQNLVGDQQFDVAYSRLVLSIDSGTSGDWRKHLPDYSHGYHEAQAEYERIIAEKREAEEQARRDIFVISAMATKDRGLVMHEGDTLAEVKPLAPGVRLEFKERRLDYLFDHETRRPYDGSELLVFRKQ